MAERDIQNRVKGNKIREPVQDLRRRAEEIAHKNTKTPLCSCEGLKLEQSQKLLQELQVHQIELTLQNEELRFIQAELEKSQAQYFNLYDLAPVGYLTLTEKGMVEIANLTAATLLDVNRSALLKTQFTSYVYKDDRSMFSRFRKNLFRKAIHQYCELSMIINSGQRMMNFRFTGKQIISIISWSVLQTLQHLPG